MINKIIGLVSLVCFFILLSFLTTTQPSSVGPVGVLVVFILMYMSVFGVIAYAIFGINRFFYFFMKVTGRKRIVENFTFLKSCQFSSVISLFPMMLIGLHSVGQVGVRELLLVMIFTTLSCLYLSKRVGF